jgi:hypothetical protein
VNTSLNVTGQINNTVALTSVPAIKTLGIIQTPYLLATDGVSRTKMISMYDGAGVTGSQTDHRFSGFGVSDNTLRYQTPGLTDNHIFYAATSATTSNTLATLYGNGSGLAVNGTVTCPRLGLTQTGTTATVLCNGDLYIDTTTPGNHVRIGYNSQKPSLANPVLNVFNNATDRTSLFSVVSAGTSSGSNQVLLGVDLLFSKQDARVISQSGHLFLDSVGSSTKSIVGYNTVKSTSGDRVFEVYNNLTDRELVFTVYSKGTASGSNYVDIIGALVTQSLRCSLAINNSFADGHSSIGLGAGTTGAGASPNYSIVGTAMHGVLTINTGTAPVVSAPIITLTIGNPSTTPKVVTLQGRNPFTSAITAASNVWIIGTTTGCNIYSNTTALTTLTQYQWSYTCIG